MEHHENSNQSARREQTALYKYILEEGKKRGLSIADILRELNQSGEVTDRSLFEQWKYNTPKSIRKLYAIQAIFSRTPEKELPNTGAHRNFHNEKPSLE